MKKIVIYILLSFYVFAQLKPIVVVVEDILAHTFWKMQHMATVHYENGHYHIHTELSDISDEETKNAKQKAPSSEKINETDSQNIHEVNFNFYTQPIISPVMFDQTQDLLAGFGRINSPPPQV